MGLRFDAIDQIEDSVPNKHVLVEISEERIRAEIPERAVHLTTEDSPQRHLPASAQRGWLGTALHRRVERHDFHNRRVHVLASR